MFSITSGGTRTPNPRFRRPMPYPLGHGGDVTKTTEIQRLVNDSNLKASYTRSATVDDGKLRLLTST